MYTIAVSGKCNTWNDWKMLTFRPEQVTMDMMVEQNATAVVNNVSSLRENIRLLILHICISKEQKWNKTISCDMHAYFSELKI